MIICFLHYKEVIPDCFHIFIPRLFHQLNAIKLNFLIFHFQQFNHE